MLTDGWGAMTDSYDMFAGLTGQTKSDLVRQVLDGVVRIDPELKEFLAIRSLGKTVCLQAAVNGVPVPVHVVRGFLYVNLFYFGTFIPVREISF